IDDRPARAGFAVADRQRTLEVELSAQRVGMLRIRLAIFTVAAEIEIKIVSARDVVTPKRRECEFSTRSELCRSSQQLGVEIDARMPAAIVSVDQTREFAQTRFLKTNFEVERRFGDAARALKRSGDGDGSGIDEILVSAYRTSLKAHVPAVLSGEPESKFGVTEGKDLLFRSGLEVDATLCGFDIRKARASFCLLSRGGRGGNL